MTAETQSGPSRELALRVASALVLIPFGLISVWCGGWVLAVAAAATAGAMGFEWARMSKSGTMAVTVAVAVAASLLFPPFPVAASATLLAGGLVAALLERPGSDRSAAMFGVLYAGGMPVALQALREFPEYGLMLTMGVMVIVWASDIGAYFAGRTFGGPLLAPSDSPNKTWSGAIGGAAASIATAMAFALVVGAPSVLWAVAGAIVSVAAQVGDLFESQLKRRFDIKHTSGLLPGHGGVMDRVDGFGAACVAAIALVSIVPAAPALLMGAG